MLVSRKDLNEPHTAVMWDFRVLRARLSPGELAVLYVGLGDKEQALSALERAYTAHDLQMQFLGIEPHVDPLRSEPRFKELVRKVGLPL